MSLWGRGLTEGELRLAREVFGGAIAYSWVRIGGGGFGPFAVTVGSRLFLPRHLRPADFAAAAPAMQALFVHELTHVWQFQTRAAWTLASWARTVAGGGYRRGLPGYRYGWPLKPWGAHNLEQQAAMVEHAFLLRETGRCGAAPAGARLEGYWETVPLDLGPYRKSRR
jgi:hypothetical protein